MMLIRAPQCAAVTSPLGGRTYAPGVVGPSLGGHHGANQHRCGPLPRQFRAQVCLNRSSIPPAVGTEIHGTDTVERRSSAAGLGAPSLLTTFLASVVIAASSFLLPWPATAQLPPAAADVIVTVARQRSSLGASSSSISTSTSASRGSTFAHSQAASRQLLGTVSSEFEDGLLEAFRQIESRVDSAVGAVTTTIGGQSVTSEQELQQLNDSAAALINEVWGVVEDNYLDARNSGFDHAAWASLRDQALTQTYKDTAGVYRAVREMMARGLSDPYCRFISPAEFSAMRKYDVTGVGLNLGTAEEYSKKTGRALPPGREDAVGGVWVVGMSRGSAADVAGIEQGDQIMAVDGVPVHGSPFQAASLIAGPELAAGDVLAPSVQLQVEKQDGVVVDYTVSRPARVVPSPVDAHMELRDDGTPLGVIQLSSFNARAEREVAAAVRRLEAAGAAEYVLDLRENRGGLVSEGLEVARLFLTDNAPIVVTESKAMSTDVPTATGPALTNKPLTILVNEHTASASEILAGALKDNCRAVLAGSRTYGKGLIQSVYELSDSSGLVITVGRYLTPARIDIDRFGIQPDFAKIPSPDEAAAALNACRLPRAGYNAPAVR